MTKHYGERSVRRTNGSEPNGQRWKRVATVFVEIAPRRSAVRARLAPWRKGPQMRAFRFPCRRRSLWITRPSQGLVKSLGVGPRIERFHRTQEVGGSSPPSSMEKRPANAGLLFSTSARNPVENGLWSSFGQVAVCAIEFVRPRGRLLEWCRAWMRANQLRGLGVESP
jgi:hypothetical protein